MTRLFSATSVNLHHPQMLPSQPQTTAKRKALDESNPLLAAAKRAKKESKAGPSAKRKLVNAEETPGGLLIVRAPESIPHSQNTTHTKPISRHAASQPPPSYPSSTSGAGPSKPPSKKFRADSQPPPAGRSSTLTAMHEDPELELDVRAMEDEADHLRRNSRAHTTIDPSFNPAFQFPPRAEPSTTAKTKGKGKSIIIDTSTPLTERETPKIERNKLLREGAMAAIVNDRSSRPLDRNGKEQGQGHRRKSSINSRGKRISSSFETTGVITQPHNSVSDSSFYKHIDCDLPEVERIRTLLIWCSLRASTPSSNVNKSKPRPSSSQPPLPPLPPISAKAAQFLKTLQEDHIRMLAEKRIDLSLFPQTASSSSTEVLRENEQNVRNRMCEVIYSGHIQKAQAEDEAWKKVSYDYEAYTKKLQASLDKRNATDPATGEPSTPSAKAKGKRRATIESDASSLPREHELSTEFQRSSALARSVLGLRDQDLGDDRIAGPSSSRRPGTRASMGREELESEVDRRLPLLQFKIDQLYTWASAAKRTTDIAEAALNERFEVLNANLDAKLNPRTPPPRSGSDPGSGQGSGAEVLSSYVRSSSLSAPGSKVDPLELLRALGRADKERPLAMVGDEARRAAREVQRREESGIGAVGDRRLTVTAVPATPRKPPGTPRRDRGGTPGRER